MDCPVLLKSRGEYFAGFSPLGDVLFYPNPHEALQFRSGDASEFSPVELQYWAAALSYARANGAELLVASAAGAFSLWARGY